MTQIISIAQRHKYILDKLKKDGYIRVADRDCCSARTAAHALSIRM